MQESPLPHVHLSISATDLEIDPADSGSINSDHPLLFIFCIIRSKYFYHDNNGIGKDHNPIFLGVLGVCFLIYLLMYFPDAQNKTQGFYQVTITTVKVDRGFSLMHFSLMHFTSQVKWVTGTCK